MKIKAKFKGSNSLGYVNGENYKLWFNVINNKICIQRLDYGGTCEYQSLKAFLNNWQVF